MPVTNYGNGTMTLDEAAGFLVLPVGDMLLFGGGLAAAMAHDAFVHRRVHRLYWLGLAVFVVAFGRVALMESEAWLVVGRKACWRSRDRSGPSM